MFLCALQTAWQFWSVQVQVLLGISCHVSLTIDCLTTCLHTQCRIGRCTSGLRWRRRNCDRSSSRRWLRRRRWTRGESALGLSFQSCCPRWSCRWYSLNSGWRWLRCRSLWSRSRWLGLQDLVSHRRGSLEAGICVRTWILPIGVSGLVIYNEKICPNQRVSKKFDQ